MHLPQNGTIGFDPRPCVPFGPNGLVAACPAAQHRGGRRSGSGIGTRTAQITRPRSTRGRGRCGSSSRCTATRESGNKLISRTGTLWISSSRWAQNSNPCHPKKGSRQAEKSHLPQALNSSREWEACHDWKDLPLEASYSARVISRARSLLLQLAASKDSRHQRDLAI